MFYIDYELVRQITEDRRAEAMATSLRRRKKTPPAPPAETESAEVIELVFGAHCESDQIGA